MCADFRDLNKANLRDYFPLLHRNILVDNTTGHALLSFINGYTGYNQVKITEAHMENTTLIT